MPRYIDAEKLVEHKFSYVTFDRYVSDGIRKSEEEIYAYKVGYNEAIDSIAQFEPTADVVERKHGEWIFDTEPYPLGNPYGHYGCDQCGEYVPHKTNFCPFCGADMRERREDAEVH